MLARTSPRSSGRAAALAVAILAPLVLVLAVLLVPAPASATPAQDYASDAFAATNKVRANNDRRPLKPHACLREAAVRQAKKMAGRTDIFHQLLGPILRGCAVDLVGENVAYGYSTGTSVVKDGWMESPGHRANILKKGYTRMGIAARRGEDGRWYVAQVFGRPRP